MKFKVLLRKRGRTQGAAHAKELEGEIERTTTLCRYTNPQMRQVVIPYHFLI